tara:strand:- start:54 stop:413 length:360 start_codon:yes stop_codon:yes gene_type:complete
MSATNNAVKQLLSAIANEPSAVAFSQVMAVINSEYNYSASAFSNGDTHNEAGTNEGSCKLFSFAQLNKLSETETLACFGDYYRKDVLEHPKGDDHANIRNFMVSGWQGISFEQSALALK